MPTNNNRFRPQHPSAESPSAESEEKPKVTEDEAREAAETLKKKRQPQIEKVEQQERDAKREETEKKVSKHQQESWNKAKEDCHKLREMNQSFSDLVAVIVAQFQLLGSMSKVSHAQLSYYIDNLPELGKGILNWMKEKKEGKQNAEENMSISRDQDGKIDTHYTLGKRQVDNPEIMGVVNTLALSYLQGKGYNLNDNNQLIHGEMSNKKGQVVDGDEFKRISEAFSKDFKSFTKEMAEKRDEEQNDDASSFRP